MAIIRRRIARDNVEERAMMLSPDNLVDDDDGETKKRSVFLSAHR